ncbi:MAG: pentapeptide repeat-containing protein [Methanoregula sp.]|uniref:pentapeptide repeat-containing protein n=1 Tax=Methanoregula sp. TaxID=2052170 RepID=UPI003C18E848
MATQKHLDILLSGVEKWNLWRQEQPKTKPNLTDADLNNLKLDGGNFNYTDFRGSKIHNSTFYYANFVGANLSGLSLRKNFFEKVDFEFTNLSNIDSRGVNFSKVNLNHTNFSGALIERAFLSTYQNIVDVNFKDARINRVNFYDDTIKDCNFSGTKLTNVSFQGPNCTNNEFICAILKNVHFSNCNLENSSFTGSEIRDTSFEGSRLRFTDYRDTRLKNVNFKNCEIRCSYFEEARTIRSNKKETQRFSIFFDKAYFYGGELDGSKLTNGSFRNTQFQEITANNADFRGGEFNKADINASTLKNSIFNGSNFSYASIFDTDFSDSDFFGCKFFGTELAHSNFTNVEFSGSDMTYANLSESNFENSILNNVEFHGAILLDTTIDGANLSHSHIFGVSVWGLIGEPKEQLDLLITPWDEPAVTVDNIEIAQFIHLLLTNEKLKNIIDTVTSKVVLILGRFNDRKIVLETIKNQLREMDLTPIIFDFTKPGTRNLTETIGLLARMSKFIITDITDPKSVPHEIYSIIPHCPSIPIYPILEKKKNRIVKPYAMFADFKKYPWVSEIIYYEKIDEITGLLPEIHKDANEKISQQKQ